MNPWPSPDTTRRSAAGLVALAVCLVATAAAAQVSEPVAPAAPESGRFEWTPTAFIQLDARAFPDWPSGDLDGRRQRDAFEVRRIRAGVDASWRQWRFEFSIDPMDWNEPPIQDAWAQYRLARAVRIRGGQFKLPGGREYGTASRRLGFLERSPLTDSLSAGRDLGAQADLRLGRRVQIEVGGFAGDGQGREHRSGPTMASRAQWTIVPSLEVAAYGSLGTVEGVADVEGPTGPNGRATSSFRFFDRVYVAGRRTRLGADAEWRRGAWRASVEVLRLEDERQRQAADFSDLPALVGRAVTTAVRWQGRRPMAGIRYDRIVFDDAGGETGLASVRPRAADVRYRGSEGLTVSGGWRVSRWLRVLGEVAAERYFEPRSAPALDRQGPYVVCGVRLQVEWPQ